MMNSVIKVTRNKKEKCVQLNFKAIASSVVILVKQAN